MPEAGHELGGTYRLTRLLGEGGMGQVWEAQHVRLPKKFAVKFLHAEALRDNDVFTRFQREAEIASSIGNAHIVDVVDFNHDEQGVPYMVLEYLDGEDLAARLQRRGQLAISEVISIAEQVAGALDAAHKKGIVHRDLKPQNIFLVAFEDRDDFVKVLDFGISKVLDSATVMTKTGAIFGTPNYMSPEQVDGLIAQIDGRTDVFALGAILYEMLAGKPAFDGQTISAVFNQVCHKDPEPLVVARSGIPPRIVGTVMRALAKNREERFASMAEVRAALLGPGDHLPAAAPVAPTLVGPTAPTTFSGATGQAYSGDDPNATTARRRGAAPIAMALGGLVVAAAAAAIFLFRGDAPSAPSDAGDPMLAAIQPDVAMAPPTGAPVVPAQPLDTPPEDAATPQSEEPGSGDKEKPRDRSGNKDRDQEQRNDPGKRREQDSRKEQGQQRHDENTGNQQQGGKDADSKPDDVVPPADAATPPPRDDTPPPSRDAGPAQTTPRELLRQLDAARKSKAHTEVVRIGKEILSTLPKHRPTLLSVGMAACEIKDVDSARWVHSRVSGSLRARLERECAAKGVPLEGGD